MEAIVFSYPMFSNLDKYHTCIRNRKWPIADYLFSFLCYKFLTQKWWITYEYSISVRTYTSLPERRRCQNEIHEDTDTNPLRESASLDPVCSVTQSDSERRLEYQIFLPQPQSWRVPNRGSKALPRTRTYKCVCVCVYLKDRGEDKLLKVGELHGSMARDFLACRKTDSSWRKL